MNGNDLNRKKRLLHFFQNNDYLERSIQIHAYDKYDNYLDYYVNEKLDPVKYLKIRLKGKRNRNVDLDRQMDELLKEINLSDAVCVVSSFHKDKQLDGFYKRVEQVDESVLKNKIRIYLDHTDLGNRQFSINRYDEKHIIVHYNSFDPNHVKQIRKIIDSVRKVYVHSVHMLMGDIFNWDLFDIIFSKQNKTVLDLHGAVSEELKLFDSEDRALLAETIEEIAMNFADRIVSMSSAMSDHYHNLYGIDKEKFIVMSILPFDDSKIAKKKHEGLNVVYAGGLQKWQNIDLIKESVRQNLRKYRFRIFTHDAQGLKEQWKDIEDENLLIDSRTPEEIFREYENCDFGYLLRDDTIINNVACPTKLTEYLKFGIIPILKSVHIGNFVKYGLSYVSLDDFSKGIIPGEKERETMIENNRKILSRIIEQSHSGQRAISDYLQND